jgi:hypothetical protein
VTGVWRKLHNEELRDLFSSLSIIRMIKLRRMRSRNVARILEGRGGEERKRYRLLVRKSEGRSPPRRPRRKWVDIIKIYLGERERMRWCELG